MNPSSRPPDTGNRSPTPDSCLANIVSLTFPYVSASWTVVVESCCATSHLAIFVQRCVGQARLHIVRAAKLAVPTAVLPRVILLRYRVASAHATAGMHSTRAVSGLPCPFPTLDSSNLSYPQTPTPNLTLEI